MIMILTYQFLQFPPGIVPCEKEYDKLSDNLFILIIIVVF